MPVTKSNRVLVCVCVVVGTALCLLLWQRSDSSPPPQPRREVLLTPGFLRYVPSAWEREWFVWVRSHHQFSDNPCYRLLNQRAPVDEYVRRLEDEDIVTFNVATDPIFSKLVYLSPNGTEYAKFIEPLVGPLRHPLLCWDFARYQLCKDFLVLDRAVAELPPERLFFDLGASTWNTGAGGPSQIWFYEEYARRGLRFTAMLLWEATRVDPKQLFAGVPPEVLPIYQYFNVPVALGADGQWSVFRALRARVPNPLDAFVVLKLDIDNPAVERQIVDALLTDSELLRRVDEFFFEHHTYTAPMNQPWGTKPGDSSLDESYKIFTALRRSGVRAHSWV